MKNIVIAFFLVVSTSLFAQFTPQKHSRVKVFLHETHISELAELGLEYDHGFLAKGKYWISDVSATEMALLKENNLSFEILVDDVQAWYVAQNKLPADQTAFARNRNACGDSDILDQYQTPENYTYGSMGGYHTYTELLTVLDNMHAKFPELVSEKQVIGDYLTQEGRPIHWLKVGNNPNVDEDKPAIFYNSLHHAREPNSLAQMIFYIWYLLENYETDAEVKYIMDNVEMYFVPCINPDGYVYNETTFPNGGGGWRKNRWVNENNNPVGVDLNRNYGYEWGLDDSGSSPSQTSEIYRGTAPFSEPETQAIRDFCVQHQFKIALNYHSFSNLLIIPWGFDNMLTPDDATYRALSRKMTEQNNYFVGTGLETVGYIVNGDSDDWMYGEQTTKPKIYSMTPEVGPQFFGFWPPQSAIDGLNKENLWQNISAAGLLKAYGEVTDLNEDLLTAEQGSLDFSFQNIGLEAGDFTLTIKSLSDALIIENEPLIISLDHLASTNFSIDYQVLTENLIEGVFDFEIIIDNGQIERKTTLTKEYLNSSFEPLFVDPIDETLANWNTVAAWGPTEQTFFSANHSITDSPFGNYPDRSSTFIEMTNSIDLAGASKAVLKFQGKWALETNYDYVQLLASTDQSNYTPLCGKHTVTNGMNQPAYNGFQNDWILEEVDLSDYLGQQVYFRFQLDSDDFVNEDGFYFDDFSVEIIKDDAGTTAIEEPTFLVGNSLKVQPNPFAENFTVDFTLMEKVPNLTLRLLNTLGQEIAVRQLAKLPEGAHAYQWKNLDLKDGIYFLRLETADNQGVTAKVFKVKS